MWFPTMDFPEVVGPLFLEPLFNPGATSSLALLSLGCVLVEQI